MAWPSSLRTSADFERVFAERRRLFKNGLTIYYRSFKAAEFRFGIVTPKRFGKAVQRNKFRRRVREVIRTQDRLPEGIEIIVCVNRAVETFTFSVIKESLEWSISQASRSRSSRGRPTTPRLSV